MDAVLQVGYVVLGMKTPAEAHIGDTLLDVTRPGEALPGFLPSKPMVRSPGCFCRGPWSPACITVRHSAAREPGVNPMCAQCVPRHRTLPWAPFRQVFASVYPVDTGEFKELEVAVRLSGVSCQMDTFSPCT